MTIAAVFPGQGSQSVGMLSELAEGYSVVQETFQEISDILSRDFWNIVTNGSADALNETEVTQPAMLAAGVATWRVWLQNDGCEPIAMAGHSLGEYTALVASGRVDFADAIKVVSTRAKLMQQAVPMGEGAMAAILGLEDEIVITLCSEASDKEAIVEAVNFNSPGQVVVAGHVSAVDRMIEQSSEAGARRAIKLPVSVPSHCRLMLPAAERLSDELDKVLLSTSETPVLHNVDASSYETAEGMRMALAAQLHKPVRWVEIINRFASDYNVDKLIEFGPGKVLFGLNRRINKKMKPICISDRASLEKALIFCEENKK